LTDPVKLTPLVVVLDADLRGNFIFDFQYFEECFLAKHLQVSMNLWWWYLFFDLE